MEVHKAHNDWIIRVKGSVNSQGRWACANILTSKTGTGLYLFRISPASAMNDDVHVL
jgi:hypothetical protein